MQHREGSLRAEGLTFIATDKPTRAGLKRLAGSVGLPLSLYLRKIVEDGHVEGVQQPFGVSIASRQATKQDIDQVGSEMTSFMNALIVAVGFSMGLLDVENKTPNEVIALVKKQIMAKKAKQAKVEALGEPTPEVA